MAMKPRHTEVGLPAGDLWLDGILGHQPEATGLVVLAERSGNTLTTSRTAFLCKALESAGLATLHVGLLAHDEERRGTDTWHQVPTLTNRLAAVLDWIGHQPALRQLPLGITARETAAAAMVRVPGRSAQPIRALASRAGRPDLAGMEHLRSLVVPMLLVVGDQETDTLNVNRTVHDRLSGPRELVIITGASRNFEEPGALDQAAHALVAWFGRWLAGPTMTN